MSERNGEPGMCNPLLIPALGRLILKGYHEFKTRPATQWDLVSKKNPKPNKQKGNKQLQQPMACSGPGRWTRPRCEAVEKFCGLW